MMHLEYRILIQIIHRIFFNNDVHACSAGKVGRDWNGGYDRRDFGYFVGLDNKCWANFLVFMSYTWIKIYQVNMLIGDYQ